MDIINLIKQNQMVLAIGIILVIISLVIIKNTGNSNNGNGNNPTTYSNYDNISYSDMMKYHYIYAHYYGNDYGYDHDHNNEYNDVIYDQYQYHWYNNHSYDDKMYDLMQKFYTFYNMMKYYYYYGNYDNYDYYDYLGYYDLNGIKATMIDSMMSDLRIIDQMYNEYYNGISAMDNYLMNRHWKYQDYMDWYASAYMMIDHLKNEHKKSIPFFDNDGYVKDIPLSIMGNRNGPFKNIDGYIAGFKHFYCDEKGTNCNTSFLKYLESDYDTTLYQFLYGYFDKYAKWYDLEYYMENNYYNYYWDNYNYRMNMLQSLVRTFLHNNHYDWHDMPSLFNLYQEYLDYFHLNDLNEMMYHFYLNRDDDKMVDQYVVSDKAKLEEAPNNLYTQPTISDETLLNTNP